MADDDAMMEAGSPFSQATFLGGWWKAASLGGTLLANRDRSVVVIVVEDEGEL